jgi:hypothetical protein
MRMRAFICAGLLCCMTVLPARAADPLKPGTTFEAETKGAPVTAMTGHWNVEGTTAVLAFGGAHAVGTRTKMRATWTTDYSPKARVAEITVECNRLSASMENKANKWYVELLILPKEGYGRGAFAYRTRLPMPEVGSGEGVTVTLESFRAQRWQYRVAIGADIVTPSELSGLCTMEAG